MAETFKDASGATKYRKTTGAGSAGDPAVLHNHVDSVVPGTGATALGKAEDAVHASGDVGVMTLAVRKDVAAGVAADGDYHPILVDGTGRLWVNDDAKAAGGESSYSALSTAAVLSAAVKASAGQVYSIQCFNNGANEVFIRLYNQTGAPAAGDTANLVWRGMIPGDAAGNGFALVFPKGKAFSSGIGVRVTSAAADNDNTALAANEVMVNIGYK